MGETVQVIPHITNEIKSFIYSVQEKTDADIVITEIGGTTGDIESLAVPGSHPPGVLREGRDAANCLLHPCYALIPYLESSGDINPN
ncbi:MAG: hypothetical protein ACLSH1_07210 [Clostridia bacterium]